MFVKKKFRNKQGNSLENRVKQNYYTRLLYASRGVEKKNDDILIVEENRDMDMKKGLKKETQKGLVSLISF